MTIPAMFAALLIVGLVAAFVFYCCIVVGGRSDTDGDV